MIDPSDLAANVLVSGNAFCVYIRMSLVQVSFTSLMDTKCNLGINVRLFCCKFIFGFLGVLSFQAE